MMNHDGPAPEGQLVTGPADPDGPGYWCVACMRLLPPLPTDEDGVFVYVHDEVPHHGCWAFDEEERPQ